MRFLVAPDSFKGTLTAAQAADAIAVGVRDALPDAEVDRCPIADGGEGTVDAMIAAYGSRAQRRTTRVCGPLGDPVEAAWAMIDAGDDRPLAVIEMAAAAGLTLVPDDRRDPTRTTTYGVGEMIAAALDSGAGRVVIGIGGSATCDGGAGMAQALGFRFFAGDRALTEPMTGGSLADVTRIDRGPGVRGFQEVRIDAACDVTNPLCGLSGAAAVYSPQKGATPAQVDRLDAALVNLRLLLLHADADAPGAGAAGGLGFGLRAFCGARLVRGIELVLDALRFDDRVRAADVVITGEGRIDAQSASGKAVGGVAAAAQRLGRPALALGGSVDDDVSAGRVTLAGVSAAWSVVGDGVTLEQALAEPARRLRERTAEAVGDWTRRHSSER